MDTAARLTARELADRIDDPRAEGIRRALGDLIRSGDLPVGARLPTIRDLAAALGTSVGAVADAWTELRRAGLLDTRRRGGTTVADGSSPDVPGDRSRATDLTNGGADAALLPDLVEAVLAAGDPGRRPRSELVLPALASAAERLLPFPEAEVLVVPGMQAAVHLVLSALVGSGDVVAIEDPTCVRNPALLRGAGARVVTIASDADGPTPEAVAAALAETPAVIAFQPVAAVPRGATLSPQRRDELIAILRNADATPWILEEDPAGPLAASPAAETSLGRAFPERAVRVTHLARAFGSGIGAALVSGSPAGILLIAEQQRRSGARVAPIVQNAVAHLLTDAESLEKTAAAAAVYARRGALLIHALRAEGIAADGLGGYFAWIPVADEHDALLALAEEGIRATPGSRSTFGTAEPHVRVGTTRGPDDPEEVAALATTIARAVVRRFHVEDE